MNLKQIKDSARQAFSDQQTQDTEGGVPDVVSFVAGFVAGAKYGISQLHELRDDNMAQLYETIKEILGKNDKLIKALKYYAEYHNDNPDDVYNNELAIQVLKEVGEE